MHDSPDSRGMMRNVGKQVKRLYPSASSMGIHEHTLELAKMCSVLMYVSDSAASRWRKEDTMRYDHNLHPATLILPLQHVQGATLCSRSPLGSLGPDCPLRSRMLLLGRLNLLFESDPTLSFPGTLPRYTGEDRQRVEDEADDDGHDKAGGLGEGRGGQSGVRTGGREEQGEEDVLRCNRHETAASALALYPGCMILLSAR